MKKAVCLLLATISLGAFAQNFDRSISQKIQRLQDAQATGDIARLSEDEKNIINQGLAQAVSVLRLDNRPIPGPGPIPTPGPGPGDWRRQSSYIRNDVKIFSDDSCRNPIAEIKPRDNCGRLNTIFGNTKVWSVSVNGICVDIADTTFAASCDKIAYLASEQAPRTNDLEVYTDDSCRNKLTTVDPGVNCDALGDVLNSSKSWSVKLFGKCVDLQPDHVFSAQQCNAYQQAVLASYEADGSRRRGDDVELFTDDSCRNTLTTVKRGMDCRALGGVFDQQKVWSVRFRGQCVDIQDTTFGPACEGYAR